MNETTYYIGKTRVSLFAPPNDGTVIENGQEWTIGRNSSGMIVLRQPGKAHPDFVNGMDMFQFCSWINERAN